MNLFTVLLKFTKSFGFLSFLWWWTLQSNPVFFEKAPFLHAFFFKLYTILVTEKNIFSFNVITTIMLLVSLYSHCLFFYLTFSGKGGLFCTSLFLFRTLVSMYFTSPSIILGSSVWSSMQSHNEHPQQPPLPGFHFMPVMSELCSQSVRWFWLVTISNRWVLWVTLQAAFVWSACTGNCESPSRKTYRAFATALFVFPWRVSLFFL